MKVTEHFKERLKERFGYEIDTLLLDFKNRKNEMIMLNKNSMELDWFPYLKNSFKKHPNSVLILIENLNLCIVSERKVLKTCYEIN
tara:strand:+ start:37 stop:294 length:258 start_codon:yes stop_codon:yes gene_type:complete